MTGVIDDEEPEEPNLEGRLGTSAADALHHALGFGLSPRAVGCFARWWQLETYLRDLLYIELGAAYGSEWKQRVIDKKLSGRQGKTQATRYMASSHDAFPISHLDTADLLELLVAHWELVDPGIGMPVVRWQARIDELVPIRNRVAHLRHPHHDDLGRIEQLLRDLERGARLALASYVTGFTVDADSTDQVTRDWIVGEHEVAQRLFKHGRDQYDIHFKLEQSVRPWSIRSMDGIGTYWILSVIIAGQQRGYFRLKEYLNEPSVQQTLDSIGHFIFSTPGTLRITLPAVNSAQVVSDAIAVLYEMAFYHLTGTEPDLRGLHRSDPSFDVNGTLSVLAWLDSTDSISLFQ